MKADVKQRLTESEKREWIEGDIQFAVDTAKYILRQNGIQRT
jgi:hypothetical protein